MVECLLDSGAAVSVVRFSVLSDSDKGRIRHSNVQVMGANGSPLDVMGVLSLKLRLGSFKDEHEFTVVRELTVECLFGADFMEKNDVLIDCKRRCLQLGSSAIEVPFIDSPVRASSGRVADNFKVSSVMVSRTVKLPAHSVLLLRGKMKGDFGGPVWCGEEGLVEGGESVGNPNYILVARSLSRVNDQGEVSIQVMNVGPMEVTLHKGTTIANFVPRRNVFLLEDVEAHAHAQRGGASEKLCKGSSLKVDLQGSELTTKEMKELQGLLEEYSELFSDGELGRTSKVKHGISTCGPPIRQPIRRQPVALRKTVQEEVHKMLKNKVIRPSTSPWSSPIIMVRKKDGSWRFCD